MQPIINTLLDPVINFGKVTVSGGYPAGTGNIAVTLIVGDGSKLPNPADPAGSFNLVWFDSFTYSDPADDPNVEIVRCIANVNDTLTLMRAQEGTSGSAKNTPGKIYKMILAPTKKTIDDIQTEFDTHSALSTGVHGVTGAIVGISDTQILTNKTITDSTNNVTARSLKSATTVIDVSSATAPSTGQVLTATDSTTATWQAPAMASIIQMARNMSGDIRIESSPSIYSGTASESTGSQTPVEMTLLATSFTKTKVRTFIQFSLEQMRTYAFGGYTCTTYLELSDGITTLNSSMLYSNWSPWTTWTSSIDLFTLNNTTITVKVFTGGSVGYGSAVQNLKLYAPLTETIN